jgi:hypothetical protein
MNLFYVQANGETFVRHIHDVEPTRWDDDNYCRVAKLTPEQIEQFGVHQLKLVTPPYYDPATQTREHGDAVLIDGVWTQNYIVSELDPELAAANTEAQWAVVRTERNKLIANTDWTQLPDAPLTDAKAANWGSYRQALRDITNQSDPFNIEWPVPPLAGE